MTNPTAKDPEDLHKNKKHNIVYVTMYSWKLLPSCCSLEIGHLTVWKQERMLTSTALQDTFAPFASQNAIRQLKAPGKKNNSLLYQKSMYQTHTHCR